MQLTNTPRAASTMVLSPLRPYLLHLTPPSTLQPLSPTPSATKDSYPLPDPYSSNCGQSEPMVLAGYAGVFFFLWSLCGDEENHCGQQHPVVWQHPCLIPMPLNPAGAGWPHGSVPSLGSPWKWGNPVWQSPLCGQTVAWSHPYSSQCGQSAPLVLAGYMGVFFFLVSHPSDEETPCGQPAPCGQTAPWSHPYSSGCGQQAPLVLTAYMAVFFFLVIPLVMKKLHAASQHPVTRQHPSLVPTHPSVASQHPWC